MLGYDIPFAAQCPNYMMTHTHKSLSNYSNYLYLVLLPACWASYYPFIAKIALLDEVLSSHSSILVLAAKKIPAR